MTTQMRHCVRAAQKGDKLAIEELLESFMPFLHHQAKRYQSYYPNLEEALSTAYHGAIHCIINYDFEQPKTVPEMIVASVHNHLRRESYHKQCYDKQIEKTIIENEVMTDLPASILASDYYCPECHFLKEEVRFKTRKALEQLPERQRQIIWLHFFRDYSYQEIADRYNLSKSTVRDYVSRGLISIKNYLIKEQLTG